MGNEENQVGKRWYKHHTTQDLFVENKRKKLVQKFSLKSVTLEVLLNKGSEICVTIPTSGGFAPQIPFLVIATYTSCIPCTLTSVKVTWRLLDNLSFPLARSTFINVLTYYK